MPLACGEDASCGEDAEAAEGGPGGTVPGIRQQLETADVCDVVAGATCWLQLPGAVPPGVCTLGHQPRCGDSPSQCAEPRPPQPRRDWGKLQIN